MKFTVMLLEGGCRKQWDGCDCLEYKSGVLTFQCRGKTVRVCGVWYAEEER